MSRVLSGPRALSSWDDECLAGTYYDELVISPGRIACTPLDAWSYSRISAESRREMNRAGLAAVPAESDLQRFPDVWGWIAGHPPHLVRRAWRLGFCFGRFLAWLLLSGN